VAEHASVVRVAHFPVASSNRSSLISLLEPIAERIRGMEGCFGISICAVREAPDEVAAVSRWASQAALDKMTQTGITENDEVRQLVAGQVRLEHFEPV
jgi:quinol monooxygenase YgiN